MFLAKLLMMGQFKRQLVSTCSTEHLTVRYRKMTSIVHIPIKNTF